MQQLEQQQRANQQHFNKQEQENQAMDPFQALFGRPSLRQNVNANSTTKDR